MKKPWWWGLPVVLAGAALRFQALERQSLWDDEMSTLKIITRSPAGALDQLKHWDLQPPLYFIQLWLWKAAAGGSLAALRANSAFWGSLALILFYALALGLSSPAEALIALALLAFSPFHL